MKTKAGVLVLIFVGALAFFSHASRIDVSSFYDTKYSHLNDDVLVCTEFTMTIDGQMMDLYYDQNNVVFTDSDCIYPFLSPHGTPYTYFDLDGTVGLADELWDAK